MSTRFLPIFISNARYGNEKLLPRLLSGEATQREVLTFCENHRLMGIGWILLLCDSSAFQRHLYHSGRVFLHSLLNGGATQHILSRASPFFDAIGAHDFDGARQLASCSRRTHEAGTEYEEDFLYVRFLMDHCVLDQPENEGRAMLQRMERVLQGSEEPRLEVCQALLARDEQRFEEALNQFLTSEEQRNERLYQAQRLSRERWSTEARLSVEGLALVMLAEHLGLSTQHEYPRIPSVARSRVAPREAPDAWRRLE
ncbi:hypothetical protein F0U60_42795 [Archangium minus]|uniref:Uncharacterized protein n=1 Tax=Archangium minus TaxID=83450 RepID=A0ABY9X405_9BACT|nr:hypothetical protein F0U60_42795 [Archangium minus]